MTPEPHRNGRQERSAELVLSGWHGHDNAGDDATLEQFVCELDPKGERGVLVLSELPQRIEETYGEGSDLLPGDVRGAYHYETLGMHGLTHLLKGRFFKHMGRLRRAKLFALGGGSLIRDNTTWRNLLRVLDEIWWARLFGTKVALYAVGVGPFKTSLGKWLIARSVKRCSLITVRDETSKGLLVDLGVPAERVHVVADPGFLITPREPEPDAELEARLARPGATAIFPSLGFIEDGKDLSHIAPWARALDRLHEKHGLHFVSLPMRRNLDGPEKDFDDVYVTELVRAEMKHPDALYAHRRQESPAKLKWLAGRFPLTITVRLHAMIFSLAERTPAVAIGYEPKVRNVLTSFGLAEWLVPLDENFEEQLVQRVESALARKDEILEHIDAELPRTLKSAGETFRRMEELL